MKLIREVIEAKSLKELITVSPDAPVVEAARLMSLWSVGALLVLQNDQIVGLVSERDYVRAVAVGESMDHQRQHAVHGVRDRRHVSLDLDHRRRPLLARGSRLPGRPGRGCRLSPRGEGDRGMDDHQEDEGLGRTVHSPGIGHDARTVHPNVPPSRIAI